MSSIHAVACKTLILAAPLLLASCPRTAPVIAPAPEPVHVPAAQDDAVAIEGAYTCEVRMGSEALGGTCSIVQAAEVLQLQTELGPHRMQGAVIATSYGFRLQGRFDDEPVEVDFFRQGGKGFAAVLQLADQRLAKINMAPAATGQPTNN